MSLCLLATTGLLGQEPLLKPESSKLPLQNTINSSASILDTSISTPPKIVPSVELPTLEFSGRSPLAVRVGQSHLQSSECFNWASPNPETLLKENKIVLKSAKTYKPIAIKVSQPVTQYPTSGNQLYQQRMLAVKTLQSYRQFTCERFASSSFKINQNPSYEQWKRLLEQESNLVAQMQGMNRLVVLVGDSLTLWLPQDEFSSGKLWLNQAISGDNSRGVLKRLSAFSQTKPDTIYVLVGINDLRQGATNKTILTNTYQIIRRLRRTHPQAEVVMQSILPTRLAAIPSQRIRYLNRKIAMMAQNLGASYLDLHSLFVDPQGNLRFDLTTDGLHLSRNGYKVWQLALLKRQSYQLAIKQHGSKEAEFWAKRQAQITSVGNHTSYCQVDKLTRI